MRDMKRKQLIILFSVLLMISVISTIWLFNVETNPKSELDLLLRDYKEPHPEIDDLKCKTDYYDDGTIQERDCRRPASTFPNVFEVYDIQASHVDTLRFRDTYGLQIEKVDYCLVSTGASMRPTIYTGNTVCFIDYDATMKQGLQEGMIIHFEYQDGQMIHRIYTLYGDYLITRGDNNKGNEAIDYQDIKGVTVAILQT